jgi:hypothetical protein
MNQTSSSSAFSVPTSVGDDEIETLKLADGLDNKPPKADPPPQKDAADSLWIPSKDNRDFQLNMPHTHKKSWTMTGKVEETSTVETIPTLLEKGPTKCKVKKQRKIIWHEETIRKNNAPIKSEIDPLIEKETVWLSKNPDSAMWKEIQHHIHQSATSKLMMIDGKITQRSNDDPQWDVAFQQDMKNDSIAQRSRNLEMAGRQNEFATDVRPSSFDGISISDGEVYLNHLKDKISLKILKNFSQKTPLNRPRPKKVNSSVDELLNEFLSSSNGLVSLPEEKYLVEPNPANETLRDRTARCIGSVSYIIQEEVMAEVIAGIIKDIQESHRQSKDVLAKGVLRGIMDVHEGNKRFLKASGKLQLLRGIIEDFSKHRADPHGSSNEEMDTIESLTVFNGPDLLESLHLKVQKEREGGMLSKLLLRDNGKDRGWIVRELDDEIPNGGNLTNSGQSSEKVPYISMLHEQGFLDMTRLESHRLKENEHIQDIRMVKLIGHSKVRSKESILPSLEIDKRIGKISATMIYPDYEKKNSILIIGTSLGRLLCYRIPWKLQSSMNSTISSEKPSPHGSPQKINSNKDRQVPTKKEEPVIEFLASNRKKGKKGDPIDQSEIVSIRCSPAGPSYILTLNKTKRVVLWSLQDLFLPIIDDHKNGTIKQSGIFSCFHCTDSHKRPAEKYIERLGTIDDEELLYRFRMNPWTFELYGKESLRPKYCEKKMKNDSKTTKSSDTSNMNSTNKTLIMKVLRAVQTEQSMSLKDHRFPTAINFFGGLNDQKQLTSLVIGCNDGEVVKLNLDFVFSELRGPIRHPRLPFVDKEFINPTQSPANFIMSVSKNSSDTSNNTVIPASNGGNNVFREIFHWHRSPVIFLETIDEDDCTLLSIDADGIIAKWCYNPESFTGSGWFVPETVRQLPQMLVNYEPVDDDKDSMQSLNELFRSNEGEQERLQKALQVSRVYYQEKLPSSSSITKSPRERNQRQSARRSLGVTLIDKQNEIKSSPLQTKVINAFSHAGTSLHTVDESLIQKDRKIIDDERSVQKRFEVTTVYHPVQDEDSDDLVQYEETAKFILIQPNALQHQLSTESSAFGMTMIKGVPYILNKKAVQWTRSFMKKSFDHQGANLLLFGRKLTVDGLELVHVFRKSKTPVPSTNDPSESHFVIASLNTKTLEFRFPLIHFTLGSMDYKKNKTDVGEQLLDFDCGPIMEETQSRLVFILTTKGIKQFGLHTSQELKKEGNKDVSIDNSFPASTATMITQLETLQSQLAFKASKLYVCPSQRSLVLSSDIDNRIEVVLLQHRLDGQKTVINTSNDDDTSTDILSPNSMDKTSPITLESPLRDLLKLGGSFSHAQLEDLKGRIHPSVLKRYSHKTILDQIVIVPNPESLEIAHDMMNSVLELMEEVVDINREQRMKTNLINKLFGDASNIGFVSPTSWPPQRQSQLDRQSCDPLK